MDDLDKMFKKAYDQASKTDTKLPPDVMLKLYAYYKQAVQGDQFLIHQNYDSKDLKNAFKFNAWIQLRGMDSTEAKKAYIKLVNSMIK